jgi:hypothetical protein
MEVRCPSASCSGSLAVDLGERMNGTTYTCSNPSARHGWIWNASTEAYDPYEPPPAPDIYGVHGA